MAAPCSALFPPIANKFQQKAPPMQPESQRIAFIGTGQMATALGSGFTRQLLTSADISGCDPSEEARQRFRSAVGEHSRVAAAAADVVPGASIVILAVKPQIMAVALQQLAALVQPSQLVVSIAAGVTLDRLAAALPAGTRLIRVMPNTPCLVGQGASGVSAAASATAADMAIVTSLLQTVGLVEVVPEHLLDAVTGLSGSGPAYVFQIIEALSDGGLKMGLPRTTATRLAAQTLLGAAEMLLKSQQHPGVLKDQVTSPGGTTIAGLHALERGALRATLINAVEAATLRSMELGR